VGIKRRDSNYGLPSKDTPLYFTISFYKTYEVLEHPQTREIIDAEIIKCFEFPQFACIFDTKVLVASGYDWHGTTMQELLEYIKFKSKGFAKHLFVGEDAWQDAQTLRLEIK